MITMTESSKRMESEPVLAYESEKSAVYVIFGSMSADERRNLWEQAALDLLQRIQKSKNGKERFEYC